MFDLSMTATAVCLVVVFVGATVQGSIGIGLGLISAPVLAIADPAFVPATIVIAVLPLTVLVAWADRDHVRWTDTGLAVLGRLPGVAVGAMVAAAMSDTALAVLVGLSVLIAVAASLAPRRVPLTTGTLVAAGATSGFMGTTTGVGGPPMALTYQHSDPATMRATVSAFFFVGALMSALALWIAGEVGRRQLELSALLIPAVVAGALLARVVKGRLKPEFVRPLVLAVCAASAVALLIDAAS